MRLAQILLPVPFVMSELDYPPDLREDHRRTVPPPELTLEKQPPPPPVPPPAPVREERPVDPFLRRS